MESQPPEVILPMSNACGSVRPPGSKSLTNRALICAALAKGQSHLQGTLDSEDTRVMCAGLKALGYPLEISQQGTEISVGGQAGIVPADRADLHCANSGTTIRFLTALTSLGRGTYRLDGIPRMRQRPIGDLLDALRQLGAETVCIDQAGFPPIEVHANGMAGGSATIRGDISSQFLSGLLMVAPYARHRTVIEVTGELVSQPYVDMTCRVMQAFGIDVAHEPDWSRFEIEAPRQYQGTDYVIEPDASAASYFWAAAAITGGDVKVLDLHPGALQGDVRFCECLKQMGCEIQNDADGLRVSGGKLHGIDVDMNDISDTVQTLAVVALFAEGPTTIRGVAHNRHKETDRIADLARELRRIGATVTEHHDGLTIEPGEYRGADMETYNDHRMAMSLALAGLRVPGIRITNPGCTAKTYPDYFRDLRKLIGQ